ncbi:hypothetical protein [Candidatus Pyrohabitans sp.]
MFHILYSVSNFINMVLLLILAYLYLQDYRKVRSTFTLGLVIFAVVLFINALLSCPSIFYLLSGYDVCPYEPFHALASAVETVALVVLLYISTR